MKRPRDIPWAELDTASLAAPKRERLGRAWAARMQQEHLAVGAFALLTTELAEEGCDPVVLEMVARAASDEVRHAGICRKLAAASLGEDALPRVLRGVPRAPKHECASPTLRVLYHVVEMCCLNETFTGVYLTEMLARSRDDVVRAALESLLADEIDHGRAGWAYLAARKGDPAFRDLERELPALVARSVGPVLVEAKRRPEYDDPELENLGWLGAEAGASLYKSALADVVLPGFEALEIDAGPTRDAARAAGFLP